ncbi:MAG: helix-turn-helix transcriptional regulator [Actinobacteria bacterium]|nr:helix-turn-helix transcriptional regulator [Actinomycetota bacterium]
MTNKIGYVWHLRRLMADRGMFATTELVPLLAARGIVLSREQVYRLVTGTPERLNLTVLVALCDILDCRSDDLIEPVTRSMAKAKSTTPAGTLDTAQRPRPRRARVLPMPAD